MAPTEPTTAPGSVPPSLPGELRPTRPPRMTRTAADIAAVCWGGFLAACAASLLAFAVIDPGRLGDASELIDQVDRMAGYGVGFLFFWGVGIISGALSVLLIRSSRRDARERISR